MNPLITDEMVEAAAGSLRDVLLCTTDRTNRPPMSTGFRESMRAAIEVVAPLIAAQALRDAAIFPGSQLSYDAREWLRAHADRIERGES